MSIYRTRSGREVRRPSSLREGVLRHEHMKITRKGRPSYQTERDFDGNIMSVSQTILWPGGKTTLHGWTWTFDTNGDTRLFGRYDNHMRQGQWVRHVEDRSKLHVANYVDGHLDEDGWREFGFRDFPVLGRWNWSLSKVARFSGLPL